MVVFVMTASMNEGKNILNVLLLKVKNSVIPSLNRESTDF